MKLSPFLEISKRHKSSLGPDIKIIQWDGCSSGQWAKCIDGAFAVVNLAAGINCLRPMDTREKKTNFRKPVKRD